MTTVPDFPSNSQKSKEETPRTPLAAVVSSNPTIRKKSLGGKLREMFTGDGAKDAFFYVLKDVLAPAAQKMIVDAVSQGMERAVYGDVRPRQSNYTSYDKQYGKSSYSRREEPKREESRYLSSRSRAAHSLDEIVLSNRGEAEDVIDRLRAQIDQFDIATVGDLYELLGVVPSYTDNKYGWSDLREAGTRRVRDGYILMLPRPAVID